MKTTYTLEKANGFWLLVIRREDGTVNDYRFPSKAAAQRWLRLARV